jgi:putative phosphoesterase
MRIGILSDTHSPETGRVPPPEIARAFEGVDLILHAGDIRTPECLDWLEQIAPVLAVEIRPSPTDNDPRVVYKRVFEVGGYTIGMKHDFMLKGMMWELMPGAIGAKFPPDQRLTDPIAHEFGQSVDIVVFGHTHFAMVERHQDIWFINPGSPTLPNHVRRLGTVALLEITPAGPEARLVNLTDFRE